MKLSGEIAGKVASSVDVNTEPKDFSVYAVDKNSGQGIYVGEFEYTVSAAEDSFQYTFDDPGTVSDPVWHSWSQPGYVITGNDGEFSVYVKNADGTAAGSDIKAYITLDGSAREDVADVDGATFSSGVLTVGSEVLNGYTGIMQVQFEKGDYSAIIHVLVVGPVVHSGLKPSVTSF